MTSNTSTHKESHRKVQVCVEWKSAWRLPNRKRLKLNAICVRCFFLPRQPSNWIESNEWNEIPHIKWSSGSQSAGSAFIPFIHFMHTFTYQTNHNRNANENRSAERDARMQQQQQQPEHQQNPTETPFRLIDFVNSADFPRFAGTAWGRQWFNIAILSVGTIQTHFALVRVGVRNFSNYSGWNNRNRQTRMDWGKWTRLWVWVYELRRR